MLGSAADGMICRAICRKSCGVSGFIKLDTLDPIELFAAQIRRSRLAVKVAYNEAFAAWDRRGELLRKRPLSSAYDGLEAPWLDGYGSRSPLSKVDLDRMLDEAVAENVQADMQASLVVLVADDALQRLIRGLLKDERRGEGYGPDYGAPFRGMVKLTVLLHAGANAIRHVSEWDDLPWNTYHPWPTATGSVYPTLDECKALIKTNRPSRDTIERMLRAMQSIDVFQRVFGIGINERIRDPVSLRVITQVDGRLGNGTSYDRFESAVLSAAREIAAQKGGDATYRLAKNLV